MPDKPLGCKTPGCDGKHYAKGYCRPCHNRLPETRARRNRRYYISKKSLFEQRTYFTREADESRQLLAKWGIIGEVKKTSRAV